MSRNLFNGPPVYMIEYKHFRRNEVYAGVSRTWKECSFDFLTIAHCINTQVGAVLNEIAKKCTTPLTGARDS